MEKWRIEELHTPVFGKPPVLLAAWPGMGNVGMMTVEYLRSKLKATPFAQIDSAGIITPEAVVVKGGIASLPEIPKSVFYAWPNPALILFEGSVQVNGNQGLDMVREVLQFSQRFGATQAFTAAALAQQMSHNDPSQVLCASNRENLLRLLEKQGAQSIQEGYIGGLNGLLLGIADVLGLGAACLLGTIPSYAANVSYPKASLEILRMLMQLLHIEMDVGDFEESAKRMDAIFDVAEGRIKQLLSESEEKDEELSEIKEEKVPQYVLDKIEQLFRDVARDKSRAKELKTELDRWNLYDLYENRFLDLFKSRGRPEGQ